MLSNMVPLDDFDDFDDLDNQEMTKTSPTGEPREPIYDIDNDVYAILNSFINELAPNKDKSISSLKNAAHKMDSTARAVLELIAHAQKLKSFDWLWLLPEKLTRSIKYITQYSLAMAKNPLDQVYLEMLALFARGSFKQLNIEIEKLLSVPALSKEQKIKLFALSRSISGLFAATENFQIVLDRLAKKLDSASTEHPDRIAAARTLHHEMQLAHRAGGLTVQQKQFMLDTACHVAKLIEHPNDHAAKAKIKQLIETNAPVKHPVLRRVIGALLVFSGVALAFFAPLSFLGLGMAASGVMLGGFGGTLFAGARNKLPVRELAEFEATLPNRAR